MAKDSGDKPTTTKPNLEGIPPSLSGVPGTGGASSDLAGYRTSINPPNWDKWNLIPTVHLRVACALSMNIDPHKLRESRERGWEPPVYDEQLRQKFSMRLRVMEANYEADTFKACAALEYVWLSDFAHWAVNVAKWKDMPLELVSLAIPSDPAPAESKPQSDATHAKAVINTEGVAGPRNAIGKLAIEAASDIKQNSQRAATVKEVMRLLKEWAENGTKPDTLLRYDSAKRAVIWRTVNGEEKAFDKEACGKCLARWGTPKRERIPTGDRQ